MPKKSKRKWWARDLTAEGRREMVEAHNRYQEARRLIAQGVEREHAKIAETARRMLADNDISAAAERGRIIAVDREREKGNT